jgi:MYXO-CTERM domain-containing protein
MHTIKIEVTDGRNTKASEIRVNVQGSVSVDNNDDRDLSGGCSTGGGSSGGALTLALLAVLGVRRRRR